MPVQDNNRFECVEEPFDTWMIWDNAHDRPAELGALALIGLSYSSATLLCRKLNDPDGGPAAVEAERNLGNL
jgi:hypothetical protein